MPKSPRKTFQKKNQYDIMKSIRGDWGDVCPTPRIVPDKTKYHRKNKHQKKFIEECES